MICGAEYRHSFFVICKHHPVIHLFVECTPLFVSRSVFCSQSRKLPREAHKHFLLSPLVCVLLISLQALCHGAAPFPTVVAVASSHHPSFFFYSYFYSHLFFFLLSLLYVNAPTLRSKDWIVRSRLQQGRE